MAEIPDIVKDKIMRFLGMLEENNIHVQKAILFGSYAKGHYDQWSDIDLAIVSDDFCGNRFLDRTSLIDYISKFDGEISPLPYRFEDFEKSWFARDEIVNHGIRVL